LDILNSNIILNKICYGSILPEIIKAIADQLLRKEFHLK